MQWSLDKIRERIRSIVTRGHVTRINKGDNIFLIHHQYWAETDAQKIPWFQTAGISANPGSGNDVQVITNDPNGDPSHRVAIVVTGKACYDAKEGEIAIHAPNNADYRIRITEDGICIETPDGELLQTLVDAMNILNVPTIASGALTPIIQTLNAMKC